MDGGLQMKNILTVTVAIFSMIALLLPLGRVAAGASSFSLLPVSAETGENLGRLIYTLEPGETATDAVVAVNNSNAPLDVTMFGTAAGTASNGGTTFPETQAPGSWISLSVPALSLEAKGREQLLFTIAVPEGASPGEYLFGIVVQETEQGDEQEERVVSFSIVQRRVLTVYVAVPGPKVASFEVASIRQVWDGPAVGFDVELHNTGNVRAQPTGTLEVTDESGKVIGSFPIELGPILAGDTLVYHISSGGALPPGEYGASVQMSYTPVTVAPKQIGATPETPEPVVVEETTVITASTFEITEKVVKEVMEEAKEKGWDVEGVVISEGPGMWMYIAIGLGVVTLIVLLGMAVRLRSSSQHLFRSE